MLIYWVIAFKVVGRPTDVSKSGEQKTKLVSNIRTGSVKSKTTQKGQFSLLSANFWCFIFFCHKTPKMSRKKQEHNYSLFFGVVATLAAMFAKKRFFEEITSSEKVRAKVF